MIVTLDQFLFLLNVTNVVDINHKGTCPWGI